MRYDDVISAIKNSERHEWIKSYHDATAVVKNVATLKTNMFVSFVSGFFPTKYNFDDDWLEKVKPLNKTAPLRQLWTLQFAGMTISRFHLVYFVDGSMMPMPDKAETCMLSYKCAEIFSNDANEFYTAYRERCEYTPSW